MLDDDGFVMYESAAIVDYIGDAYRDVGAPLFSSDDVKARAIVRRKIREADEYVAQSMERLVDHVLFTPPPSGTRRKSARTRERFLAELVFFESDLPASFWSANWALRISRSIRCLRFRCGWKREPSRTSTSPPTSGRD